MTIIPQQQLFDRWDALPDSLKDVIFDEPTTDFIWKTAEDEHIPDEKIYIISKLVGYVLMGFLHPEDLAKEIQEQLNVDIRIATAIQDTFNKRIFSLVRSDIDKAYQPMSNSEASFAGPKILEDITQNLATSQTIASAPTLRSTAIPNANIPSASAAKTNRLSDIGWSRSRTADPVVKLDITQVPAAAPTASSAPMQQRPPSLSQPTAPANPALGEFARLSAMKKAPNPSAPAVNVPVPAPAHPTGPAPVMLHQDTSFAAAPKNADFKIAPSPTSADMHLGSVKSQSPIKPAVLEFGGQPNKPTAPTGPIKSSVTHYTEFQTSLSKFSTQSSGPREINQIMPPVAAPAPIPIPRPPQPPTASGIPRTFTQATAPTPAPTSTQQGQKEQVIVKDFL